MLLLLSFGLLLPQSPLLSCIQIETECVHSRAGKRFQLFANDRIVGNGISGGSLADIVTVRFSLKPLVNEGMQAIPQFLHSRLPKLGGPDTLPFRFQIEVVGERGMARPYRAAP